MFIPSNKGADASTASPAYESDRTPDKTPNYENTRHIVFGTPQGVHADILNMHKRGYAEPNDWSQPVATGRPNEVMRLLTKRVAV